MGAGNFAVFTAFKAKDGVTPVFKNMTQGANTFGNKLSKLNNHAQTVGKIFKRVTVLCAAGYAAFTGFAVVATKTTIDYAKEVRNMQRLTGESVEEASKMTAVGQKYGVTSDGMGKALRKLTISAQSGSKEFLSYGLRVKDARGKLLPASKLLEVVADKYKKLGGGLVGAAFAQKMMGKSAMEMLPLLEKGSDGVRKMYEEAEKMGLVLSESTMKGFIKFSKAQKDFKQAMTGIQISIGSKVLPYLAQLGEQAQITIQKIDFKQVGEVVEQIFNGISNAIKTLQPVFDKLGESFKYLNEFLVPEFISLSPGIQKFFDDIFIPAVVLTVDALNFLFVAIDKTYNFIKDNWIPILSILAGVGGMLALKTAFDVTTAAIAWFNTSVMISGANGLVAMQGFARIKFILGGYTAAIWKSVTAIWAQTTALLANPWTWVAIGIAAVVAGAILIWKNWDKITETIGIWWNNSKAWLSNFWTKIQEVFGAVGNCIKNNFVDVLLTALGPIGWIIKGLMHIGGSIAGLGKGGGFNFPGFNGAPQTNYKQPTYNIQGGGNGQFGGKIDVGIKMENNTGLSASSSLNLSGSHSLNLVPMPS